jgi:aldehyde:ferredoxin oxidoreductase
MTPHGYRGSVLHVNLSTGSFEIEKPSQVWYRTYLGSRAMALYYLLKDFRPGTDPFSKKNLLIFASNVISGAPISGLSSSS